jgi:DNA-directed RNA polymerase subunit RPC12/RpoP
MKVADEYWDRYSDALSETFKDKCSNCGAPVEDITFDDLSIYKDRTSYICPNCYSVQHIFIPDNFYKWIVKNNSRKRSIGYFLSKKFRRRVFFSIRKTISLIFSRPTTDGLGFALILAVFLCFSISVFTRDLGIEALCFVIGMGLILGLTLLWMFRIYDNFD